MTNALNDIKKLIAEYELGSELNIRLSKQYIIVYININNNDELELIVKDIKTLGKLYIWHECMISPKTITILHDTLCGDIPIVDIGIEFCENLIHRDRKACKTYNAIYFKHTYLWDGSINNLGCGRKTPIILDFINVRRIGPSFVRAAFEVYVKHHGSLNEFYKIFRFENLSKVQKMIIELELKERLKNA